MRNETLKNLLLTASLISASAFLTACGDKAADPAKSSVQDQKNKTDKEVKDVATAHTQLDVSQHNLGQQQKEAVDSLKKEAAVLDAEITAQALLFPEFSSFSIDMSETKAARKAFAQAFLPKLAEAEAKIKQFAMPTGANSSNDLVEAIKLSDNLLANNAPVPTTDKAALRATYAGYRASAAVKLETVVTAYKKSTEPDSFENASGHTKWLETFLPWYNAQVKSMDDFMKVCDDRFKAYSNLLRTYNDQIKTVQAIKDAAQKRLNEVTSKIDSSEDLSADIIKTLATNSYYAGKTAADESEGMFTIVKKIQQSFLTKKAALLKSSISLSDFSTALYEAIKGNIYTSTLGGVGTRYSLAEYEVNPGTTGNPVKWKADIIGWISDMLSQDLEYKLLFASSKYAVTSLAAGLSSVAPKDLSSNVSLRQARTAENGSFNGSNFKMNGVAGQSVELGLPLFVQLKGDVSSAKATEATTGSVAYRLGNTVIGAIQGYANSGAGFGTDSRQLETSVVASHSFGSFFIEGQIGSVSATEVHNSNWSGLRSQVTLGLDTEFVSPFVQLTHRQLDRSGVDLNETTAYLGLDMEVAKLAADTYSVDTRLLAKAGYGSKDWSAGSKTLGSTAGFSGVVEWSASLNLNSGVAFSSNLALDTTAGSSAGLTVSLDR